MSNEADTCRTYIVPKLHAFGWEDDFITEQMVLTHEHVVAYLDGLLLIGDLRQATLAPDASAGEVNALKEVQSQTQEEFDALLPSVLDRAFKGEL